MTGQNCDAVESGRFLPHLEGIVYEAEEATLTVRKGVCLLDYYCFFRAIGCRYDRKEARGRSGHLHGYRRHSSHGSGRFCVLSNHCSLEKHSILSFSSLSGRYFGCVAKRTFNVILNSSLRLPPPFRFALEVKTRHEFLFKRSKMRERLD